MLKKGTVYIKRKDARQNLFEAVRLVEQMLKTSLGPRGSLKMHFDHLGIVTLSKESWQLFWVADVQHPGAKMLSAVARTMKKEVGDGSTSAVILTGALVRNARKLIDRGLHPTVVANGYAKALNEALMLLNGVAIHVPVTDRNFLLNIARTSMACRVVTAPIGKLGDLVVDAALRVTTRVGTAYRVDVDSVKIDKKESGTVDETSLIDRGIVVDKQLANRAMRKSVRNAKIALLDTRLEVKKPLEMHERVTSKFVIDSPDKMKLYTGLENKVAKSWVDKFVSIGASVVVNQRQIGLHAQELMVKADIMGVQNLRQMEMDHLLRAVGGRVVTHIQQITAEDLGYAGLVEERALKPPLPNWMFFEECTNPKSVGILVRGGSLSIVNDAERVIQCGLMVVKDVIERPAVVPGGGAIEMEISTRLKKWGETHPDREQLAILEFANALQEIPLTLAENCGMDPIDVLVELTSAHASGRTWWGVDSVGKRLADTNKLTIYDPLKVKEQALKAAGEVAMQLIRVDGLVAEKLKEELPEGSRFDPRPPALRARRT